jgi:hypothetical protein
MSITKQDLLEFNQFADAKLAEGPADSLGELVQKWEHHRHEIEATLEDVRLSHEDIAAGRVLDMTDGFRQVRQQLDRT